MAYLYLKLDDAISDLEQIKEKLAILAAFTGDLDRNMFAAEVVFHAEGLVDLWSNTAIGDIMDWYESCIIADMKNGEIGLDEKIVEKFYDVDDESNQIQRQLHGKQ